MSDIALTTAVAPAPRKHLVLALLAAPGRLAAGRWRRRRAEREVAGMEPRLLDDTGLTVERYLRG